MMRTNFARAGALAALVLSAPYAHAVDYQFTTIAPEGSVWSQLVQVNDLGQAAGQYSLDGVNSLAFVYGGGSYTFLSGPAGALGASAAGINDSGTVVGSYYTSTSIDPFSGETLVGPSSAYIYANGSYTTFNVPGAVETYARGVSNDGRYVSGFVATESGGLQGFVYDLAGGSFTVLGSPDAVSFAAGINAAHTMVGDGVFDQPDGSQLRTGYLYDLVTGTRTDLNFDGYGRTSIRGIDDSGRLAGYLRKIEPDGSVQYVGFVGTPDAFQEIAAPGGGNTFIYGMNNLGWLAGEHDNPDGSFFGVLAAPVPEPETWALMLAGLAALAGLRKRRQ